MFTNGVTFTLGNNVLMKCRPIFYQVIFFVQDPTKPTFFSFFLLRGEEQPVKYFANVLYTVDKKKNW